MSNKILRLVTLVIITLLIIIYAFNDTVLEDGVTVYDADHETWTDQLVTGDSYEVSMIPSKTIEVGLRVSESVSFTLNEKLICYYPSMYMHLETLMGIKINI